MKNYDFNQFADKFVEDANNLLNELESNLLELEQDTTNGKLIEAVFRAMHTLKGIGSMFGFNIISDYTHHLETLYDKIRSGLLMIDSSIFVLTFASVDHLRNLLSDKDLKDPNLAHRHAELTSEIEDLAESKKALIQAEKKPDEAKLKTDKNESSTWYIQFICSEDLIRRAVNLVYIFQDLAKLGTFSIFKHSSEIDKILDNEDEVWGIVLNANCDFSDIEEVFIFISEYVRIVKSSETLINKEKEVHLSSIYELAESLGTEIENHSEISVPEISNKIQTETTGPDMTKAIYKTPRISVGADKLDKLMYLVSELFTTRSELVTSTRNADLSRIKLAVEKIDKLASQFRNNALSIRLVPLRELTLKFKRLIRDLSLQLGKKVTFEVQGDETELDKNLVDTLADPFMHLIRNCIDHGIESPEIRKSKNKTSDGTIRFEAYQSGNYIFIQIGDDGKGIDKDYIRSKAIDKGFIKPTDQLSDKELLEIIFLPGFSTAESLTQVSGRGVGMDVVKRAINNLRGTVEIETEKDKGTTFIIRLQQTIAIMDTLLIRAGNSYFTVILEEIEICELKTHEALYERQNDHIQIAGELIPFVSLRDIFSINAPVPETERIVVIKHQDIRYAIVADSIIGQYQAVIKPLGEVLRHKEYLSGASIMGDGNIAFMLDTQKLCSAASVTHI